MASPSQSTATSPRSSPTGTPVPADLSNNEKNIDSLVNDYRQEIAAKRKEAIQKLQEEKMQHGNKDIICAGIFQYYFREMLDIQYEAVVKGNPPTGEDKNKLVARCEALLMNADNFEKKGPKDRNNATITLSQQFIAFLVWFKKAVNEMKEKISNGQVVVDQSIVDASKKAEEASSSSTTPLPFIHCTRGDVPPTLSFAKPRSKRDPKVEVYSSSSNVKK